MATTVLRSVVCRRGLPLAVRSVSTSSANSKLWKEGGIPSAFQHETGKARTEIEILDKGIRDYFNVREPPKVKPGTRERPTPVPTTLDKRMVGCLCTPDCTNIEWMVLEGSEPQRCYCGNWFQLIQVEGAKPHMRPADGTHG